MSNTRRRTNIQRRRRLQELFERGTEVRFNAGGVMNEGQSQSEDDVIVWVTPPSPLQREQAVRDAQATRAKLLLKAKNDPDSVPAAISEQYVREMSFEDKVMYLSEIDSAEIQTEATRNVLAQDEWEDIDALRDLMRQWEEAGSPTDDPEWNDLLQRDIEFGDEIQQEVIRISAAKEESLRMVAEDQLTERALEKRLEVMGNQAFMDAYQNNLVFYACRDEDDHRELFFENVEDMRSYPDEVQEAVLYAFSTFITEAGEAKNSPRVADGSEPSEPPVEPETSESSTPEA